MQSLTRRLIDFFPFLRNSSFRFVEPHGSCTFGSSDVRRLDHCWPSRTNGSRFVLHSWCRIRLFDFLASLLPCGRNGSPAESRYLPAFRLAKARQNHCRVRRRNFLRRLSTYFGVLFMQSSLSDSQEAVREEDEEVGNVQGARSNARWPSKGFHHPINVGS